MSVQFRQMEIADGPLLALQESQRWELGVDQMADRESWARDVVENGRAWTAYIGERVVALMGFRELFPTQAVAWLAAGEALGRLWVPVTHYARERVEQAPYRRIEAVVDLANAGALRWARRVGLTPAHVLRNYGAQATDHILFERVQ